MRSYSIANHHRFKLDETDHAPRYVSVESPMAKALIARSQADEALVVTPRGRTRWTIVAVAYAPLAANAGEEDE